MKKVEVLFKSGERATTECEELLMEWEPDGRITQMAILDGRPDAVYVNLNDVDCVLVTEIQEGEGWKKEQRSTAMNAGCRSNKTRN